MSEIKNIPLQSFHENKGARFVPFAGWNMPVQYTSIIQEHMAVRKAVGLFDVSHMGEILLSGDQCVEFLNHLLTNDYSGLEIGASKYSMMCYEDGGVVDDLIVYRLEDKYFLICVNASNCEKDFEWMQKQAAAFDVVLKDKSDDFALLAIQGPRALEFMEPLVGRFDLKSLKRFHHEFVEINEVKVLLSATGYTGEDGYELYIPADEADKVAGFIAARAGAMGLQDFYCGLGCRDSLRLEAGYPLYGHEISDKIDPITACLGWTVKFKKEGDFVGKDALQARKSEGTAQKVKFFKLSDRRIARQGEAVWSGDNQVGEVLSGTFSPVAGVAIGSMLIDVDALEATNLEVRLRGKPFALEIVKPPIK